MTKADAGRMGALARTARAQARNPFTGRVYAADLEAAARELGLREPTLRELLRLARDRFNARRRLTR
jgi:hypothetical protein